MTLIDDYLKEQETFVNKYGENTIVLMQVGHFYECYGVDNSNEKSNSENLYKLADILDIQLTRKNKNIVENSRKNPLMIGVNLFSIDKYIQILLNNNFTSVLIKQTSDPPYVEREVTNIYSPGTNIEYNLKGETNNLMCIYLEKTNSNIICVGISIIDLSTGKNCVYETYSKIDDLNYSYDEVFRMIQSFDPKEIIIIKKNIIQSREFLVNYLDLSKRVTHFKEYNTIKKAYFDINYQKTLLEKVFKNTGLLSVIEFLDLERKHFGLISYIILLDFAYEHNTDIILKIEKPDILDESKYLTLTNNTINQLNLIENKSINLKYDSLFSVLNKTSTKLGKRLLRERLLNPIIDINILNKRYDYVDCMIEKHLYLEFEDYLSKIQDIERLHRKMSLKLLQPADFATLDFSYEYVKQILDIDNPILNTLKPNSDILIKFNEFIETYTYDFDLTEIVKYHLDKIHNSFFRKGIYEDIDIIQQKIEDIEHVFKKIIEYLSKFIDDKSKNGKSTKSSNARNGGFMLKLDHTDRDGYYISLTSKRCDNLKKNLKNKNYPKIKIKNYIFETHQLETKTVSKPNVRLVNTFLKDLSRELIKNQERLHDLCVRRFLEKLEYYDDKYGNYLRNITDYIGEIDVIKSVAKTSLTYGYTRPKISNNQNIVQDVNNTKDSFINCKEIRHPIIERINTDINYVTNDIKLGNDVNGILLFGTNAAGKSSLMKAIGLNIIMAQAGFFVASSDFNYYPYQYLFTRINNNDNIFKGESSFAVEMSELRSILKRSNKRSLILGDELCSGTENISALAIFSSSVIKLNERGSNFVFATHLHDLCKIPQIKELKTIKMFHLKVIFNEETGELIYDRKLEEGNGPTIYGLEVCRAMDMDNEFLLLSEKIRKQILGISNDILEPKKSHFNSEVFVHQCYVCDETAEDVHHIKFQCSADENNIIDKSIQKDVKSNLVPLCKKCHQEVHNGSLTINGYIQTSEGIKLDFKWLKSDEVIEKKNIKKKLGDLEQEIIRNLRKEFPKMTQKQALIYLEKTHNIKISIATFSKVIKGIY